jgi:phasin family protein
MQAFQNQFSDFYKNLDMNNYTKMWQDSLKFFGGNNQMNTSFGQETMNKMQEHVNSLMAASLKNMEALMEAGAHASQSTQEMVKQKFELAQKRHLEVMSLAKDLMSTNDPESAMTKQVEFFRKSMESSVTDLKDIADTVSKVSMDIFTKTGEKLNKNMCATKNKHSDSK